MRSKGKIKQSHGGGVFMVKPTQRLEVIKKTQSHREWVESEGGKEQFIKGRVAEVEGKKSHGGNGKWEKEPCHKEQVQSEIFFFFKSNGSMEPSP